MDLDRILSELRVERDMLERAVAHLETLTLDFGDNVAPVRRSTRGRKFMGDAERRVVSARMKKYWASRRRA